MIRVSGIILLLFLFTSAYAQKKITYTEHIAPIIQQRCAPCHRPGTAAPFSLLTYDDVAKRASLYASVESRPFISIIR